MVKKLQFGDELAGYILCDFGVSYFPKPSKFLRTPRAVLTEFNLQLYSFPSCFIQIRDRTISYSPNCTSIYLKIWLKPHLSMVPSLNIDKKTVQILPTSIGFSALVRKSCDSQIFTPICGDGFVINLLNILGKYGSIYLCNFFNTSRISTDGRREQMYSDWF